MAKVGRKTDLTDELLKQIKSNILDGKDLKTTAKACEIDEQKLYNWKCDNYLNIGDKIENWKLNYQLSLATHNLKEFLKMNTDNVVIIGEQEVIKRDTGLERIKADMTKFTLETIGKKTYGKNIDLTTKGNEIKQNNITFKNFKDESDSE